MYIYVYVFFPVLYTFAEGNWLVLNLEWVLLGKGYVTISFVYSFFFSYFLNVINSKYIKNGNDFHKLIYNL